ncbi:MAG: BamA/TamA family outer membrane protein [Leptospiraceae bacterium]|nr:BamA/TamA family outer membrane protein [Leptospiraceae bacterium]MDW7976245.1 BamA/TamA family outer membrane protein [Leptospiraceae bacterium]
MRSLKYFIWVAAFILFTSGIFPQSGNELRGLKFTGIPLISFSTDDGVGYGVRIYGTFYEQGFAPFKYQAYGQFYKTTKGFEYHEFSLDSLKFLGSPFRIRMNIGLERYLNAQFYGYSNYQDLPRQIKIKSGELPINENIQPTPVLYEINENFKLNTNYVNSNNLFDQNNYNKSQKELKESQDKYFNYDSIKPFFTITSEDFIGDTNFKWFVGVRLQRYRIQSYYGDIDKGQTYPNIKTLIDHVKPVGYDATEKPRFVNTIRLAFAYDSRPRIRELNPNDGIFTDIHYEGSGRTLGSNYTFSRYTFTFRQYIEVLSSLFNPRNEELVFGYRVQVQKTDGNVPFFEAGRIYTMRESALGLGGNSGIRGYPANQFVDRVMGVFNTELRWTAFRVRALGGIDFVILAYYDVGRVAPSFEEFAFKDFHRAAGGGIRIVWQMNTIINISYGRSRYEANGNFSFNHMF